MGFSFYLGANTPLGFYSCFEKFTEKVRKLYIIKGGPGSGKSTMMKKIARFAEEHGRRAILIYCSSDSESLDGVFLPDESLMYVDGTAPHVLEAKIPGACEELIDFGQCFDVKSLMKHTEEIRQENETLSRHYRNCYLYLSAAGKIRSASDALYTPDDAILEKKALNLALRTIPRRKNARAGTRYDVFLGTFSSNGRETRHELDGYRLFPVFDPFSNSGVIMEFLADYAVRNGYNVFAALDPYFPDGKAMHVIIPEISAAFVTQGRAFGFDNLSERKLRLAPPKDTGKETTALYRRNCKLLSALESEAAGALCKAKKVHDRLEEIYHPYVDFAIADRITEEQLNNLSEKFEKAQA